MGIVTPISTLPVDVTLPVKVTKTVTCSSNVTYNRYMRTCEYCGNELPVGSRSDRRFCSASCKTKMWRSGNVTAAPRVANSNVTFAEFQTAVVNTLNGYWTSNREALSGLDHHQFLALLMVGYPDGIVYMPEEDQFILQTQD